MNSRRNFLKLGVLSPYLLSAGGVLLVNKRANAFLPLVTNIFVGGFVRATAGRSVVSLGVRNAPIAVLATARGQVTKNLGVVSTREYGRKTAIKGSIAGQFGFSAGLSVSVSPDVLARAQEYAADAIWIKTGVQNNFELEVRNRSDKVLHEEIAIFLRDVDKDRVTDRLYSGSHTVLANSVSRIPFVVANLPYKGVVRLSVQSTAADLSASPSGTIVVAEQSEIEFGD